MDIGNELNSISSQIETKQKELYTSVKKLQEIQNTISSIKAAVSKLLAKISDIAKKEQTLKTEYDNLRTQFNTADKVGKSRIKSRTDEISQQRKALAADYNAGVRAVNTNNENLKNLESSSDTSTLMSAITALETEINELTAKQIQLQNALAIQNAKESPIQDEPVEASPVVTAPTPSPAPKPAKKKTKKPAAPVVDITPSVVAQASAPKGKSSGGRPPKPPKPPAPPTPSAPEPEPSGVGSSGEPLTPEQLEFSKTRIRDKKAAEKSARFEKSQREDEINARLRKIQQEKQEELEERAERDQSVINALASIALERLATEERILQRSKDVEAAAKERDAEIAANRKANADLAAQEAQERAERDQSVINALAPIALERLATEERILQRSKDVEAAAKERDAEIKQYEQETMSYWMGKHDKEKRVRDFENNVLKAHEAALKIEADKINKQEKEIIDEWVRVYKQKAEDEKAHINEWLYVYKQKAEDEKAHINEWLYVYKQKAEDEKAHIAEWMGVYKQRAEDEKAHIAEWMGVYKQRAEDEKAHIAEWMGVYKRKKEQEREDKEAISKVSTFVKHSISMFKSFADALLNMSNEIRKIQQQFGINAGVAANVIISSYMKSFGSLFSGASTPFVSAKQILETSQGFQEEFGGVLTGESATAIAQRGVRLGITPEQQATARRVFMTQTGGDREKAIAAESKFIAEFEAKNLTAKDAMKAIQQYSELIARNGTRFQTSFARAAIDAKKIGVDLSKVDQIGDNIIGNFEGFLEKSAELGAMGFGFDTSRLAELAETGDTGALLNELRSQLASTGKDITNLRRSEQLALSEAFGLSMADMQRLAGKTAGSGEQTMESLQESSNSFLSKLVNSSEKIFTVMGTVAGILGGVVSLLLAGIEFNTARIAAGNAAGGLSGALGRTLGGPMAGVGGKLLKGVGGIGAGLSAYGAYTTAKDKDMLSSVLSIASAAGTGFLAGGPAGAAIGGGLGLIGALAGSMTADDMVSKSGYGKRTLVTPTATVALNDKDNIVAYADDMVSREAGVNLLSKGAIVSEASNAKATSVNVDTSKLEAKLDKLAAKIASMGIYMDGNKVGKVLVNNSDVNSVGVFRTQARATL